MDRRFYGRCIDNTDSELVEGVVYKLRNNYDRDFYDAYVNGAWRNGYFTWRFELVENQDIPVVQPQNKEIWKHHRDMWS